MSKVSFKSYVKSNSIDKVASLTATGLSFSVSIIGLSNFELSLWWHYLCAFAILVCSYLVLFCFSLLVFYVYFHCFKKAKIQISSDKELNSLKRQARELYLSINEYEISKTDEYRAILKNEISNVYNQYNAQLTLVESFAFNEEISKENKIVISETEFEKYAKFKEYVEDKMNYKD